MIGSIIVAVLSFLGTCIGSLTGIKLIKYRIEQLEKKVDKHNTVIERTYRLEDDVKYIKEEISELKERC
jgi:hypothetical protein